jgi:two-component system sensor histidine kinase/response regulator
MSHTILIVDDNPNNLRILSQMVMTMGHEIRVAKDGIAALASVRGAIPDLVLLDINMPIMDSYETCRQIKADPALYEITVIFVSTNTEEFNKSLGFEVGAVDYITKPLSMGETKARINTHLKISAQRQQLKTREKELEQSNGELNRMIQIISHDLANSLTTISMATDLMRGNPAQDHSRRIAMIAESSALAIKLITDVRAHHLASQEEVKLEPVSLPDAVHSAWMLVSHMAEQKNIRLEADLPAVQVLAEAHSLILSVLANLFTNAIKFSPAGSHIRLTQSCAEGRCRLLVRDQGVGIAPDRLASLFVAAPHKSTPGTAGERGCGFGLPLIHRYIQAYQGQIEVSSTLGEGSVFTLDLGLA